MVFHSLFHLIPASPAKCKRPEFVLHGFYYMCLYFSLQIYFYYRFHLQYTMLSGQVPFQSSRSFRSADFIMQRITQGDIRFEGQQWESISPAAKDLIKGMSFNFRALWHRDAALWVNFQKNIQKFAMKYSYSQEEKDVAYSFPLNFLWNL